MSFTTGLALAFFLLPGLAATAPVLTGRYRAEPYGTLELKTEGEHVSGRIIEGGPCHFDSQREVLVGEFEGSVLVAQLTVCQTGSPPCAAEQTYSVLGFYSEADKSVVAHVRVNDGCQTSVLRSGRFVLTPVGDGSELPLPPPPEPGGKRGGRDVERARFFNEQGKQLYLQKNFEEASKRFKLSLEYDPGDLNWAAYLGRGSSLLKLGQVEQAIKDLERSRTGNAKVASQKEPGILYMLGCAYGQKGDKDKALEYLGKAVNAGYRLHEVVDNDPDLTRALGEDSKFKDLVKKSREKKPRAAGGSATPATP